MRGKKAPVETHRVFTGIRLPPLLFSQMNAYAETQKHTRTTIIETAIREFLEREGVIAPASNPVSVASSPASVST
jgi:hypothetical protein